MAAAGSKSSSMNRFIAPFFKRAEIRRLSGEASVLSNLESAPP